MKGGDFRAREANVYRLAQISVNIIDQCVAQGVPFAREYSGYLDNRSLRRRAGVAHVLRARPDRPAVAAGRVPGAGAADRRWAGEDVPAHRDARPDRGRRPGARHRHPRPDHRQDRDRTSADAVVLGTGGYGNVYYLSTNAKGCNATAIWRAHKRGALFANPCFTQIHPTCIPVSGEYQTKLTLMSESLRNDGRVWVPLKKGDKRPPSQIPEAERDYFLERKYPELRQPGAARRGLAQRQGGLRRRPRRGRDRPGRLPGFPRRHPAPGRARHQGALRQPVRHVRAHHRRGSLQGADAHLPGHPLHHGRPVGGLQPDVAPSPACT